MNKYQQYRNDNPLFIYKSYNITEKPQSIDISFDFEIPGLIEFHPGWSFSKPENVSIKDNLTFERLVFSLGMAEAVSYWKAVCAPEMRVECGELSEEQAEWWKKLYYLGLGEFFYVNGIKADYSDFINIVSNGKFICTEEKMRNDAEGCLIPIGGGKDSALTLETLKSNGFECRCYSINKRCSVSKTVKAAGFNEEKLITASRKFDRTLINLNNEGYLNGHTPFSSIVAFSAEITAYLHSIKYIVLSNEASANESTVSGENVNHQYSKSFEFERDFHEYEKNFLKTGVYYFSFLRPLSEFQIAKMFVNHKKYLSVFRSCNLGSKVSPDIWCADCPKCLFVALIMSPFLSSEELSGIFGKNLLDDKNMLVSFIELIGRSEHKPFECVGSIDEVNLAVTLAINNYEKNGIELPFLLNEYKKSGYYNPEAASETEKEYCSSYNGENLLPSEFESVLKQEMRRLL